MTLNRRLDNLEDDQRAIWAAAWRRFAACYWQPERQALNPEWIAACRKAAGTEVERAILDALPDVEGLDAPALLEWFGGLELPDLDASDIGRWPSGLPEPPAVPTDGQIETLSTQASARAPAGLAATATLYGACWARAIAHYHTGLP